MPTHPDWILYLRESDYEAILGQTLRSLPNECCGLLAGTVEDNRGVVQARFPLTNILNSPTAFAANPREMFAILKMLREQHWQELAIYHSHPTSHGQPSQTDREQNYSPAVMVLIFSVPERQLRAWWVTDQTATPADWKLL